MKAKLLLLLCCLFAIEGWANSNDIHLLKDSRSNPMVDMSSCEKGEYTIHIILNDCLLEGTFTVQ